MSGFTAFVETVRNRWHAVRRLAAGQGETLPSPAATPVVADARAVDPSRRVLDTASGSEGSPQRLGIDRQELQRDYPKILRDANLTCLYCKSKRQCLRELEAGTAVANAERFCPNADLFAIFADGEDGRG
jgi:hypothetical protein